MLSHKTMKATILYVCILVITLEKVRSRPAGENHRSIEIDSILNEQKGNGTIYGHILSDGSTVVRRTYSKLVDGAEVTVVEGEYSFVGTDKLLHKTTYVADEHGYRAKTSTSNMTGTFVEDSIDPKVLLSLLG